MLKIKTFPNMCVSPPRCSRKGVSYRPYSPTTMTKAYLSVIDDGMPIRRAAHKFGLPETTLRNRVSGRVGPEVTKSGREPLLTMEEENNLVQHIKVMASCGYGYSRAEVVDMATSYAVSLGKRDHKNPFSLMWFHNFMRRWPELKVRKPRSLELARAKACSEEAVKAYFHELDFILTKYNLKDSPEKIYNIDEKGLKLNYTPPKIVSGSGDAPPSAVTPGKGETVTVIGCGNALGQQIPPFFVFPGQRMRQELLEGASPGADGTVSATGWSNTDIFMNYLTEHFPKYAQGRSEKEPILILYDGHRSHISLPLIDWARSQNIHLFILPAHTSHVLQPLDIGCFGPFEKIYNHLCHKYMREHSCTGVDKYSICRVACEAYRKALSADNLVNSFEKAGIYKFNPLKINQAVFKPAEVLKQSKENNPEHDAPIEISNETQAQQVDDNMSTNDADLIVVSEQFFKQKEDRIGKRDKPAKKRRCLSSVISGKAITERTTLDKINLHIETVSTKKKPAPKTSSLKTKKVTKGKSTNKSDKSIGSPKASTSGINRKEFLDYSENSSDEEIRDEEKCCQCGKFQPEQLKKSNSIYFTKWGQCMYEGCLHWTHLQFCCSVSRLRAKDTFYCPCHGIPCAPVEE